MCRKRFRSIDGKPEYAAKQLVKTSTIQTDKTVLRCIWRVTSSQRFLSLAIHCWMMCTALGWQKRTITWPFLMAAWTFTSSLVSSSWNDCEITEGRTPQQISLRYSNFKNGTARFLKYREALQWRSGIKVVCSRLRRNQRCHGHKAKSYRPLFLFWIISKLISDAKEERANLVIMNLWWTEGTVRLSPVY